MSRAPDLERDLAQVSPAAAGSDEAVRRPSEQSAAAASTTQSSQTTTQATTQTATTSSSNAESAPKKSTKDPGDELDGLPRARMIPAAAVDRKSTRLNSSHV